VKAGANRGFFTIGFEKTLKGIKKKLTTANAKVKTLHVLGRWRILCTGLQRRYPDGGPTGRGRGASGSGLSVDARWARLMKKVLEVTRGEDNDWSGALRNIDHRAFAEGQKVRRLQIFGKWAQLSRGMLQRHYARRGAKARVAWVRFARRLLTRDEEKGQGR